MARIARPEIGLYSAKQTPGSVNRRSLVRPVHAVRICHDNRPYEVVPWTIPPALVAEGRYQEPWQAHRDFYIARCTATAGRHDPDTHPADGTPGGQSIKVNLARITFAEDDEQHILASDARLVIPENHHRDAVNDEDDGPWDVGDFNIRRLAEGDKVYVDLLQVGTSRPGGPVVVTIVVVPIP